MSESSRLRRRHRRRRHQHRCGRRRRPDRLLAKVKSPTTSDVTTGILSAIDAVLAQLRGCGARQPRHAGDDPRHQRDPGAAQPHTGSRCSGIGGPATHSIPPLIGWPADLRAAISCRGDHRRRRDRDDRREIVPARRGRHPPLPRQCSRAGRRGRDHQRVRAGLIGHELGSRPDREGARRVHPRLAEPRDRLARAARAGERHYPQRGAAGGGGEVATALGERAERHGVRPAYLRAERRHADGPGLCAALPDADHR